MTLNDPLADVLSNINNAEKVGKLNCIAEPSSKTVKSVLNILKKRDYIKDFKEVTSPKGNVLDITLSGKINKCSVIKPKYSVKVSDLEKFEKRFLPAKNFGVLIISTSKDILTHYDAKEKNIGGRLIAYCY